MHAHTRVGHVAESHRGCPNFQWRELCRIAAHLSRAEFWNLQFILVDTNLIIGHQMFDDVFLRRTSARLGAENVRRLGEPLAELTTVHTRCSHPWIVEITSDQRAMGKDAFVLCVVSARGTPRRPVFEVLMGDTACHKGYAFNVGFSLWWIQGLDYLQDIHHVAKLLPFKATCQNKNLAWT